MWTYNYNGINGNDTASLAHWKYISRKKVGDKWRYTYDKPKSTSTKTKTKAKPTFMAGPVAEGYKSIDTKELHEKMTTPGQVSQEITEAFTTPVVDILFGDGTAKKFVEQNASKNENFGKSVANFF